MKMSKKLILLVLTVTVCLLFSVCKKSNDPKTDEKQKRDVLQLSPRNIQIYEDYPATLQGREVIEIRTKIEGYLEELYVDEGAYVTKGQRLFRISSPQYEQELRSAEAGILTAQAEVDAAEMDVRKTKPLVEKNIVSNYQLETAEYALKTKKAALAQAKAALANARANIGYTIISSPADGFINTIPYKKGSLVSSTSADPLTTLSNDKELHAYFAMNEKQLLNFNRRFRGYTMQEKLKNLPQVQLILSDGSLYDSPGKIETASGIIETATGSVNFRAAFPNEDGLLKSGGSASIRIPFEMDSVLVVPQSATYELQNKQMVYVLSKGNTVISKTITTTPSNDGQFFIINSGLSVGDQIILNGLTSLKDSMSIEPNMVTPQSIFKNIE